MRNSKDVLVLEREKGAKLFLVSLQLKNQVGSIADLTGRLEKGKFNLLSAFMSTPDLDGYGNCSFFVEAPKQGTTPAGLRNIIEKSRFVAKVRIKEAHKGHLVDSHNIPHSRNSGDRAIMLRTEFFTAMEDGIRVHFESGADVVLYEMGYHHGEPTWRNLLKSYEVKTLDDLQEALSYYAATGWGFPEAKSLDPAAKTAEVRFNENFECSLKKGQMGKGSNFVRGHLDGLFEVVLGAKVDVSETTCIAKGDQTCTFTATPRSKPPY